MENHMIPYDEYLLQDLNNYNSQLEDERQKEFNELGAKRYKEENGDRAINMDKCLNYYGETKKKVRDIIPQEKIEKKLGRFNYENYSYDIDTDMND